MTIKELKAVIANLPDEREVAVILPEEGFYNFLPFANVEWAKFDPADDPKFQIGFPTLFIKCGLQFDY